MTVHTDSEADFVATALARACGRHFGRPVTIEALGRESGGASRQTWSFDALMAGGGRPRPILPRDPPPIRTSSPPPSAPPPPPAPPFPPLAAPPQAGPRAPQRVF